MARLHSRPADGAQHHRKTTKRVTRSGRPLATSYREASSSSENDEEESTAVVSNGPPSRVTRASAAASRKRTRSMACDDDSDEASQDDEDDESRQSKKPRVTRTTSRSVVAPSTETSSRKRTRSMACDDDSDGSSQDDEDETYRQSKKPRVSKTISRSVVALSTEISSQKRTRSATCNNKTLSTYPKRKVASAFESPSSDEDYRQSKKPRVTKSVSRSSVASSAEASSPPKIVPTNIPAWASLPYHVLSDIFEYAATPLCDERFQKTSSTQWLLKTSLTCRAFLEPCLKALYKCPPLAPMNHAHGLVQHLKANQNSMSIKYRNKIETIKLEVSSTATYSFAGQGVLDIHGLVRNSTMVKDVEIYHEKDFAPYQNLREPIKWSYPDSLFDALDEKWTEEVEEFDYATNAMVTHFRQRGPIKLRSWRWNSRLAGKKQTLDKLGGIHLTASFIGLKKLAFVNYQTPKVSRDKQDNNKTYNAKIDAARKKASETLAAAIKVLPNVEHLIFESCDLVNDTLLPLLPPTLRVLEIVNCKELEASDLITYLDSKGANLRELILNHNHSLSLSFLPCLGLACPHLEVLRMNLHYYAQGLVDSNPDYDVLLFPDEVPTWPSSLRVIELNQLRNWDIETVEMFFQSISDSAEQLPNLRQLIIKANLSTNLWKVRAEVRAKWEETLKKVFLSKRPPPNPAWTSTEAFFASQEVTSNVQVMTMSDENEDDVILFPGRGENKQFRDASPPEQVESSRGLARKATLHVDPAPLLKRGMRSTRSRVTYTEPDTSDESVDELAQPKTSDIHSYVSPPRSASSIDEMHGPGRRSVAPTMRRELAGLHATAGRHSSMNPSSPPITDPDSEEEPLLSRYAARKKAGSKELFIQGLCDTVDVSIGNLRPRGEEMKEDDFLDDEPDDDSDWNGVDHFPNDETLAW